METARWQFVDKAFGGALTHDNGFNADRTYWARAAYQELSSHSYVLLMCRA